MNPITLIKESTLVDNTTAGVAAGAMSSPVWLPWLHSASEIAAQAAPILGALWLVVQIVLKIRDAVRNKEPK